MTTNFLHIKKKLSVNSSFSETINIKIRNYKITHICQQLSRQSIYQVTIYQVTDSSKIIIMLKHQHHLIIVTSL